MLYFVQLKFDMFEHSDSPNDHFEVLQDQVATGALRIFDITTTPRSIATILGRTLGESSDNCIYVHEPFSRTDQDIETAAGYIMHTISSFRINDKLPTTVITKNYPRNTQGVHTQWRSLCAGTVYAVRNPLIQEGSLATRYANDILIEPGADILFQGQLTGRHFEEIEEKIRRTDSWLALGEQFGSDTQSERTVIIDSTDFVTNPEQVLRQLCRDLGLRFHTGMLCGWQKGMINANNRSWNHDNPQLDRSSKNGWIGRAMRSTGIGSTKRMPLEFSSLPGALGRHIKEVALPVYEEITARRHKVRPKALFWIPGFYRKEPEPQQEFIEYKGEGHPDEVCNRLSDEFMRIYTAELAPEIGDTPHGHSDKVVIGGGEAEIGFGHSIVRKRPTFGLYGKVMRRNGSTDYAEALFARAADTVLRDIFDRSLTGEGAPKADVDIAVNVNAGIGAEHHPAFYTANAQSVAKQWDHRLSNDTVACTGRYPFTPHEEMTVELGNYLSSPDFKQNFPETGKDVKILTQRIGKQTMVTLCVPFIAEATPSETFYKARKSEILQSVAAFVTERVGAGVIHLNTKDIPGRGYLTVFGSAFDKGDHGMTGRGNRYDGMISLTQPSGVEAFPGKNPRNSSGRLYTAFAFDLAQLIYTISGKKTYTYVTAYNGDPLGAPRHVTVIQSNRDVTKHYARHIMQALELVTMPGYTQDQTPRQAFRSCHGLLQSEIQLSLPSS